MIPNSLFLFTLQTKLTRLRTKVKQPARSIRCLRFCDWRSPVRQCRTISLNCGRSSISPCRAVFWAPTPPSIEHSRSQSPSHDRRTPANARRSWATRSPKSFAKFMSHFCWEERKIRYSAQAVRSFWTKNLVRSHILRLTSGCLHWLALHQTAPHL